MGNDNENINEENKSEEKKRSHRGGRRRRNKNGMYQQIIDGVKKDNEDKLNNGVPQKVNQKIKEDRYRLSLHYYWVTATYKVDVPSVRVFTRKSPELRISVEIPVTRKIRTAEDIIKLKELVHLELMRSRELYPSNWQNDIDIVGFSPMRIEDYNDISKIPDIRYYSLD